MTCLRFWIKGCIMILLFYLGFSLSLVFHPEYLSLLIVTYPLLQRPVGPDLVLSTHPVSLP